MNSRELALREALLKNDEESQRWQMYIKENETAIENMTAFGKRLTVDVMVPVGKKALMPGNLLHTNEVLVGHYQGYFWKCSAFKAKEICNFRIKNAKDQLKKLEMEADLWQNKLDKPYAEGVIPSGEEREIIEDFNEEAEKLWKEEHKIRVKQAKQKEREEREKRRPKILKDKDCFREKKDEEIFKMLEEAELMEELEEELDNLQVDELNDETLRKLISGEIRFPNEKMRLAHEKAAPEGNTNTDKSVSLNIVKIKDISAGVHLRTNNNDQPNQELSNLTSSEQGEVETEEDLLPEEVSLIKQQAKYLNVEDQIGFYDYQIQIIRQKLQILPLRTQEELNEKIRLLNVLECLEELLEEAEESVGEAELAVKEEDEGGSDKVEENGQKPNKDVIDNNMDSKLDQKRRISFALENQTLEFREHEAVTQMLPSKMEKPQRDIIRLEDVDEPKFENNLKNENCLNKCAEIQNKVEKNLQYVSENQSKQDFDLVQKILQSSCGHKNTLYIRFKHSNLESCINTEDSNTVGSPADIYNLFLKSQNLAQRDGSTLFINSYEGEDQVKTPVLKESYRHTAFTNPKSEFSNPLQAKSILKNKSAVDKENRYESKNQEIHNVDKKSKKKTNKKDELYSSAYNNVMNEVVEKTPIEPEPLPDVKFIDAHTPKKRISRFKQMRQEHGNA